MIYLLDYPVEFEDFLVLRIGDECHELSKQVSSPQLGGYVFEGFNLTVDRMLIAFID